jgi:hypothetical protein
VWQKIVQKSKYLLCDAAERKKKYLRKIYSFIHAMRVPEGIA